MSRVKLDKKVGTAILALAASAALAAVAGCSSGANENVSVEDSRTYSERTIILSDGLEVTCIAMKAGYAGGLSCDWIGAKK